MPRLVARAGAAYVVMHWRGHSRDMAQRAVYRDVAGEVRDELRQRVDSIVAAGVDPSRIILDPGLGFAKDPAHNWALLTRLNEIAALDGDRSFPVLIGASRKSFLGKLLALPDGTPRPFAGRDTATAAVTALAAAAGAWGVRVHEVAGNADAVGVAMAWRTASPPVPAGSAPEPAGSAPEPAGSAPGACRVRAKPRGLRQSLRGPHQVPPGLRRSQPGAGERG